MAPHEPQTSRVDSTVERETGAASAVSLDGLSGPARATELLDHPALRPVFCPNTLDSQAHAVKALIDESVDRLATRTPEFVTPGVSVLNRPGDGEKSVIHLPGFREKKILQWAELEPFRSRDAAELREVGRRIEAQLGVPCDARGALAVIVERMKTLLRESIMSAVEETREWSLKQEIRDREAMLFRKVFRLIPAVREKDRQLAAELEEVQRKKQRHAELHEGNYVRDPMRAGISLMRRCYDSLWFYRPAPREDGLVSTTRQATEDSRVQRVNTLSIALASIGIFEKGAGHWAQDYPSSPLQFWIDHIEPYIDRSSSVPR